MKLFWRIGTLAMLIALCGLNTFALDATANLSVTATVIANCTISAGTPLDFGNYDAISANAASAKNVSGTVGITCTTGTSATVMLGQGSNADTGSTDAAPVRRMKNGSSYLSYGLFKDVGLGTTWGNTVGTGQGYTGTGSADTITVYGSVPAAQNAAPVGSYSDTVVVTVSF